MKQFLKNSLPNFLKSVTVMSLLSISTSYAQTSGNVTLNVTLTDVLALTVNDNAVALNFATVSDYSTGLTIAKSNQLSVTSNRSYDLRVKANSDLTSGQNTIPVSNVSVRSTTATGMGTTPSVSLSTSDQDVATNANAAIVKTISMEYSTSANNQSFAKAAGTYTTILVYSVVAR
jgi:hypothetical protein